MLALFFATLLFAILVATSIVAANRHKRRMKQSFGHRIHVNGIRGKSSVTRLVAATLREAGIPTIGKTTGTAARIFFDHDTDHIVPRKEANISEQRRILNKYLRSDYRAVVFECMAVNPLYQRYLEDKIMHSTIGIITNVREDHMDQMGRTLPDIARSLANTIPQNGHFITAETNPEVVAVFKQICAERHTQYHQAPTHEVSDQIINGFGHYEYKENVAIAIEVGKIVGIHPSIAIQGMHKALPDPGAFKLEKYDLPPAKTIYWANLFAINDRESFVNTVSALNYKVGENTKRAFILNNRQDRPERVAQFVDIALNSFRVDYIITFGDYEQQVSRLVKKSPLKHKPKVIHLGNSTKYRAADGQLLWQEIQSAIQEDECLLVGAVNIHTAQSQSLLSMMSGEEVAHA